MHKEKKIMPNERMKIINAMKHGLKPILPVLGERIYRGSIIVGIKINAKNESSATIHQSERGTMIMHNEKINETNEMRATITTVSSALG